MDSDPSINLSEFNTDFHIGDPYIDAITIFHSGYGAEFGGSDCHGTPESSRIWSHSWTMYTGAWTSNDGSVRVSNYHINPGLWDVCGHDISRIGVVAHETAHFLGLPDLYDSQGGNGIGHYCLMSDRLVFSSHHAYFSFYFYLPIYITNISLLPLNQLGHRRQSVLPSNAGKKTIIFSYYQQSVSIHP